MVTGFHQKSGSRASLPRLYIITDRWTAAGVDGRDLVVVLEAVLAALPPGSAMVQLREKDLDTRPLLALASRIADVVRTHRGTLLINGRLDVALAIGADGLHLPDPLVWSRNALVSSSPRPDPEWAGFSPDDIRAVAGRPLLIGVSTHSERAVWQCARAGADFVVFGPVFATPSKAAHGAPAGLSGLRRAIEVATEAGPMPVLALGGITGGQRAADAMRTGAHGIAAIRALLGSRDPARTALEIWTSIAGSALAPADDLG